MLWVAGIAAGVVAGLWMASMTYSCGLCVFAPPRFAVWTSCLAGCAASLVVFGAITALDRHFVPSSFRGVRQVSRFFFEDLARHQTN